MQYLVSLLVPAAVFLFARRHWGIVRMGMVAGVLTYAVAVALAFWTSAWYSHQAEAFDLNHDGVISPKEQAPEQSAAQELAVNDAGRNASVLLAAPWAVLVCSAFFGLVAAFRRVGSSARHAEAGSTSGSSMAPAEFRELVDASFGPYLAAHGFSQVDEASAPGLLTAMFRSREFTLWIFGESAADVYGRVSPNNDDAIGVYLGGVLAYLSGASDPVRGAQALARWLEAHHSGVARLFAPGAAIERKALNAWIAEYAERSLANLAQKAALAKARRKW